MPIEPDDEEASFNREFMPIARVWADPASDGLPARISSEAPQILARYPRFRRCVEEQRHAGLAHWYERRGELPHAVGTYRILLRRRLLETPQSRIILYGHIAFLLLQMGQIGEARRASNRGLNLAVRDRHALMCITRLSDLAKLGPVRPTPLRLRAFRIAEGKTPPGEARHHPARFAEAILQAWRERNSPRATS